MNKTEAKKIAETITNEHLLAMFEAAKAGIKDWTKISSVNKGMTKGMAWNILAKDFDVKGKHHPIAKKNMIWEFGDFLPEELRARKQKIVREFKPVHRDPIF